jgi:hypothetical protein
MGYNYMGDLFCGYHYSLKHPFFEVKNPRNPKPIYKISILARN